MSLNNGKTGGNSKLPPRKPINPKGFRNTESTVSDESSRVMPGGNPLRSKPLNMPNAGLNTMASNVDRNAPKKSFRKPLNIPTTNNENTSVDNALSKGLSTPHNKDERTLKESDSFNDRSTAKKNADSFNAKNNKSDFKGVITDENSEFNSKRNDSTRSKNESTNTKNDSLSKGFDKSSDVSTLANGELKSKYDSSSSNLSSNNDVKTLISKKIDSSISNSRGEVGSESALSTPENIDSNSTFKFNPNVKNGRSKDSVGLENALKVNVERDSESSKSVSKDSRGYLGDSKNGKVIGFDKKSNDDSSTLDGDLSARRPRLSINPYAGGSSRSIGEDPVDGSKDSFTNVDNDSNSSVDDVESSFTPFKLNFNRGKKSSLSSDRSFDSGLDGDSKSSSEYLESELSESSGSYFDDDSVVFDDNLVDETVQFYDYSDSEVTSLDDDSSAFSGFSRVEESDSFGSSGESTNKSTKGFRHEIIESTISKDFNGSDSGSLDNDSLASGGSFDDMLGDLFDDDVEFDSFEQGSDSFEDSSVVEDSGSVFEGFSSSDSAELISDVVANASSELTPSSEDLEVIEGQRAFKKEIRSKMKRDRAEARRSLTKEAEETPVSKPVDTRSKPLPIDSLDTGFRKSNVREILVDDNGDKVSKSGVKIDGVTSKDDASVESKERQRYRYLSKDGRMNVAELSFFKNFANSKAEVRANPDLIEGVRSPLGWDESELERKARADKIIRTLEGKSAYKRNSKLRFNQKDRELLQFLALFRYATDAQLSRMFSEAIGTTYNRLKKLRQQGLVIDKKIYGNRPIWFLTAAGMILSGYDLPRITESKLTFSMFPHQFTVNNTAANLWGANLNVLNQDGFPAMNRVDDKGKAVYGEQLVSELEIQSSFGKMRMFDKSDVYRPQLLGRIDREFKQWEESGGPTFGDSPEMHYGNEYMWALYPPMALRVAYHVPDLVIKRPRNLDGTPNSIAVEIEISNKALDSYERTLRAYKADKRLYKKVVWVCKNTGPARKLIQVAKDIGLYQEGRIDIVPILTENGVFKERDLWTI